MSTKYMYICISHANTDSLLIYLSPPRPLPSLYLSVCMHRCVCVCVCVCVCSHRSHAHRRRMLALPIANGGSLALTKSFNRATKVFFESLRAARVKIRDVLLN